MVKIKKKSPEERRSCWQEKNIPVASKKILLLLQEDLPVRGQWCSWSSFGVPACWPVPGPCLGSSGVSVVGGFVGGHVIHIWCVSVLTRMFVFPASSRGGLFATRFIPSLGPSRGIVLIFFLCVWNNAPIYESKRALVCTVPALALKPAPSLAGILDDLEGQLGVDQMKQTVVNIMQQSAKSFV